MAIAPSAPAPIPPAALALLAQARALQLAGNLGGAVRAYQQAIAAAPANPAGYQALGSLLLEAGDMENTGKVLRAVPAAVYSRSASLRLLHGRLLARQGRLPDAIRLLAALRDDPGVEPALLASETGRCHDRLDQLEDALACYRRAWDNGLRDVGIYRDLGGVYHKLGMVEDARRCYEEGLDRFPDDADLKHDHAVLLLRSGDFQRGFERFRDRFRARAMGGTPPNMPIPAWDGRRTERSLLVIGEQGIGDQLAFASLLPGLRGMAGRLGVAFDPRLNALLHRSFPDIVIANPGTPLTLEQGLAFDCYLAAADMGTVAAGHIGRHPGYLRADAARAGALRARYQAMFPGKRLVGISWKSSRALLADRKSIAIPELAPLLLAPDCQFISLQYGDVAADVAAAAALGASLHVDPAIDSLDDLDGLAAQVAALDHVITASNSTAHLAAALDVPTWVLLPSGPGLLWIWGLGDTIAWYPRVRPFRAAPGNDWRPVVARVRAALAEAPG